MKVVERIYWFTQNEFTTTVQNLYYNELLSSETSISIFERSGILCRIPVHPFLIDVSKAVHVTKRGSEDLSVRTLNTGLYGRLHINFVESYYNGGKEALESVVKTYAPNIEDVPVIIADLQDEESIKKMTAKAKIVANCCGPYKFYGESVIKACIETKTHHIDVTGETTFMEEMQLKYDKAARDAGIYIISACGFDSIPSDLGVVFIQQKFGGDANSIEAYINIRFSGKHSGSVANYATLESLVYAFAYKKELRKIREKIYPEPLPDLQPKLKFRGLLPHRSAFSDGWSVLFPGADRAVVYRTQRFFYEKYKQRPVQFHEYVTFKSFFQVLAIIIMSAILFLMTKFSYGRNLILKYPGLFTLGYITHEPPKEDSLNNAHISLIFLARGWKEKLSEPTDVHADPPNKEMVTKVSGTNAYVITAVALILSAVTILKESDKMPKGGGVLTSGAAFSKTSIIDELNKNGITFEVISSIEK
ncbi:hypothetical protein KPH14_004894 [Odynerus spinipes]|uniref:Saccharopine dehydrogenase NADP binding domain-containing protein n=1 Tax=Odynerus spinipes TaxID=1348599 RepID=A0AAD9RNV8_9HYME|nr:hypothetical protein KPH14_004894 [Odynerus spinipes]